MHALRDTHLHLISLRTYYFKCTYTLHLTLHLSLHFTTAALSAHHHILTIKNAKRQVERRARNSAYVKRHTQPLTCRSHPLRLNRALAKGECLPPFQTKHSPSVQTLGVVSYGSCSLPPTGGGEVGLHVVLIVLVLTCM